MIEEITKVDVQKARQALNSALTAKEKLEIAKACGMECSAEDERCQHWIGVCQDFLKLFGDRFPERK
jgi:hypothetical protein